MMSQDINSNIGDFGGAVSRLSRLLDAAKRINTELAALPGDMNQDQNDATVNAIYESVFGELSIPLHVYCDSYPGFSPSDIKLLMRSMTKWNAGKMGRREVTEFFEEIAESADLDWCYVFSDIPIKELSPKEQEELLKPVVKFGTRSH